MESNSIVWRFFLVLLFSSPWPLNANPKLPHLFSDHMVLQSDKPIGVWGTADPGERISVTLGRSTAKTTAAPNGKWSVSFPAMPAGGPFLLEIRGKRAVQIKDVVLGEVWVASGQSNMTFALSGAATAGAAIRNANDPGLRFFTVPKRVSLAAQTDTLSASWEVCTPETAQKFSAVAYFFARDLRNSLHVPVGIILTAWPGTTAEEWAPPYPLLNDPVLQPIAARWDAASAAKKAIAAHGTDFSLEFDDFELLPAKPSDQVISFSKFSEGSSQVSTGGTWNYSWQDAPESIHCVVL